MLFIQPFRFHQLTHASGCLLLKIIGVDYNDIQKIENLLSKVTISHRHSHFLNKDDDSWKLIYKRNCFVLHIIKVNRLKHILILSRLENCFRPHSYGNWVSLISAFQRKWIQMELWNGDKPLKNMSHPNWNANVTEHKLQSIWINHLLSGCLPIWLKLYLPAMRYLSPLSHDDVVCVKLVDGPLNKRSWNWTTQNMTF